MIDFEVMNIALKNCLNSKNMPKIWLLLENSYRTFLCQIQPQTLPHLFYRCPVISNFWSAFQNWWLAKHKKTITLTERNILFGWHDNTTESKDILNYVTLVAKYYIFCTSQDNNDVPFDGFPSLLKNKLDILQQLAFKNKTIDIFNRKWKDFIWAYSFLSCTDTFSFATTLFSFFVSVFSPFNYVAIQ